MALVRSVRIEEYWPDFGILIARDGFGADDYDTARRPARSA